MGTRESIPAPLRLSLNGPAAVHDATAAARRFAAGAGIDPDDASRLAIIVEELVTNLYDHGGLSSEATFDLELSLEDAEIFLAITDPATPFDPRSADIDGGLPARGGGAGLKLVRAWATAIDYSREAGLNRLTLRLPVTR